MLVSALSLVRSWSLNVGTDGLSTIETYFSARPVVPCQAYAAKKQNPQAYKLQAPAEGTELLGSETLRLLSPKQLEPRHGPCSDILREKLGAMPRLSLIEFLMSALRVSGKVMFQKRQPYER